MKIKSIIIVIISFSFTASCQKANPSVSASNSPSSNFSDYWFQGKAELTSYTLEQARYGEMRKGTAVTIFVTEDFSNKKQVKLDNPERDRRDAVKVLKLNMTKKFNTGVYPYSMMSSVFTPIDLQNFPRTLKTTTSSQEWCGHTFSQLNENGKGYDYMLRSYFESEGDENAKLEGSFLEDEIWNRIRINPSELPIGEFQIIPGGLYSRLSHRPMQSYKARAILEQMELNGVVVKAYQLEYLEFEKSLKVYFEEQFPFSIIKWEEKYKSGFGKNAQMMITTAIRNKSIMLDYWSKNHVADSIFRETLGLD